MLFAPSSSAVQCIRDNHIETPIVPGEGCNLSGYMSVNKVREPNSIQFIIRSPTVRRDVGCDHHAFIRPQLVYPTLLHRIALHRLLVRRKIPCGIGIDIVRIRPQRRLSRTFSLAEANLGGSPDGEPSPAVAGLILT